MVALLSPLSALVMPQHPGMDWDPRGQWDCSYSDVGRGLIQTLKGRQNSQCRQEAEQTETLIAGKFYEDNKNIIINGHEYFMEGVALV